VRQVVPGLEEFLERTVEQLDHHEDPVVVRVGAVVDEAADAGCVAGEVLMPWKSW